MNITLKIEMVLVAVITLFLIIHVLNNKNMSIRYSIVWMILPLFFLIMALFSDQMIELANSLGFELLSNMIFFITCGILFIISFSLTIIVSNLNKKMVKLTQEVALLKKEDK